MTSVSNETMEFQNSINKKRFFVIKYNLRSRRWEREEREEGKANSLKKTYTLVLMCISWEILHFNELVRTFGGVNKSISFKITERTELGFKEPLWFSYTNINVYRKTITWDLLHNNLPSSCLAKQALKTVSAYSIYWVWLPHKPFHRLRNPPSASSAHVVIIA